MGSVFIFVFVVCCSTCASSWGGGCRVGTRLVWLCMQIIEVSDGST